MRRPCMLGEGRACRRRARRLRAVALASEGEWRHGRGTDEAPKEAQHYFG